MDGSLAVNDAPTVIRFKLKNLLLFVTAAGLFLTPAHWFGAAYLVSASFSTALVMACWLAYKSTSPGWAIGVALIGVFLGFFTAIGMLVFFLHAILNVVLCVVLVPAKVRPRTLAASLALSAVCLYALVMWNGAAEVHKLAALRDMYPFESLESRLTFERVPAGSKGASDRVHLTRAVAANLDEQDESLESRYFRRAWVLRELHEHSYRQFARAAGFGIMRMPSVSAEGLELAPPSPVKFPLPIAVAATSPAAAQLFPIHRVAILDFLDPERMGYLRNRNEVAGFEAHGFSSLAERLSDERAAARKWQVIRLELVGLLRHDTPRVYVAESMPTMDQLADVPHRPLNAFEETSLPQLVSQEDIVVDSQPNHIQMLGAIRAGKTCLECHDGERGKLLGAFSYEIVPIDDK